MPNSKNLVYLLALFTCFLFHNAQYAASSSSTRISRSTHYPESATTLGTCGILTALHGHNLRTVDLETTALLDKLSFQLTPILQEKYIQTLLVLNRNSRIVNIDKATTALSFLTEYSETEPAHLTKETIENGPNKEPRSFWAKRLRSILGGVSFGAISAFIIIALFFPQRSSHV